MSTKSKQMKFNVALAELDRILDQIDQGKVDLDDLPETLKHANALIELCQEKIKRAEVEVKKVLAKSA